MNKEYRKRIRRAEEYISQNLHQELTLEEIAGKACFSKYHFHRIFKAVTGEAVSAHIRRLRLEKAANRILTEAGESITEIALDCGFGSSQNFATAFKKQFGCSPRTFREQNSYEKLAGVKENDVEALAGAESQNYLIQDGSNSGIKTNLWINLMEMPTYRVAYERVVGSYGLDTSEAAFKNLLKWAYRKFSVDTTIAIGIVWDNPEVTNPEQCRHDACITIPDHIVPKGNIGQQEITGGRYVVGHCEVSNYRELEQAYEEIFGRWFPLSDYVPADKAAYEIYLNNPANHPRGNLLIDICIPVDKI